MSFFFFLFDPVPNRGFKGKKPDPPGAEEAKAEIKFTNDGSFLDKFKKMQQERERDKKVAEPPFLPSATAGKTREREGGRERDCSGTVL